MATFDLFGNSSRCNITVGYISTDRGFVDGIGIHEANKYAQLNPGTQFIFRNRDFVKYLNINEVNKLTPDMMLPEKNSAFDKCSGIVGLNPDGDTSQSVDDFLSSNIPPAGGSTQSDNVPGVVDKTKVNFYGGGGVGVQANPVIGIDGAILDVDVIHGGFGYQYAPIVDIHDDTGSGAGVVARSIIKTSTASTDFQIVEFDSEDDFEEYDLNSCIPTLENVSYGQRFGSDGKVLGKWDPFVYLNKTKDPVAKKIDEYQSYLLSLGDGTRIENDTIIGWWSSRNKTPIKVVGPDFTSRTTYDVYHWAWGANPGTNDPIDNLYIKLFGRRGEPEGLAYWKNLQSSGQSLTQIEEGMKLQPEWKRVCEGECIPVMPDVTYLFGQYYEYDKENFMNKNAISPIPMSNAIASDNAGKTYTFEWEENFPWVGDYIFNIQCDNRAYVFIDGEPLKNSNGEAVFKLGSGGAAGNVLSPPVSIKHTVTKPGVHKITANLENIVRMETKKIQTAIDDIGGGVSDDVTFNIKTASLYANGFEIPDLGIDESKEYGEGKDIVETITKTVEYGRVYDVKVRSNNQTQKSSNIPVVYKNLNPRNNPINVNNNGKRIDLIDRSGRDTNAIITIDKTEGGSVIFTDDGRGLKVSGKRVKATITLRWSDNPRTGGVSLDSFSIADKTWTRTNRQDGSVTEDVWIYPPNGVNNNSNIQLKTKGEKVLVMEDWTDESWDDLSCAVSKGKFYGISGDRCKYILPRPDVISENTSNIDNIFNTLDWIAKADRTLWKTNPDAGVDANFSQKYGVTPFNPIPPDKIGKDIIREEVVIPSITPTVKFVVENGDTYIKVIGDGRAKVNFRMDIDDRPGISSLALSEIKIKTDADDIVLKRDVNRRFANETGFGEFTSGKKYLVKTIGGSSRSGQIQIDSTTLGFDDDITSGYDQNGLLKITAVNPIQTIKQIPETVMGYPDYPHAATDDFAGFHDIIWNNITFPEAGNYAVEIMVDDNVELVFSKRGESDIILKKEGVKIEGVSTGKSVEITYFKKGSYTLKAILEQRPGATISSGNPMLLAVNIKAAFVSDEITVISQKSWLDNPLGIAMTIDAPLSPPPTEPPLLQEGRCPNNPLWSTRMDVNSSEYVVNNTSSWWPVRVDGWSKFSNRYAISPLPPLSTKGTDGSGGKYSAAWKVDIPFRGFYGLKGTVDNVGRILIDSEEVLGPNADKNLQSVKLATTPDMVKILLEKGVHQIEVEVENDAQYEMTSVDKKIWSTADWANKQTKTEITVDGPTTQDVTFNISSASLYANSITLFDGSLLNAPLFSESKEYGAGKDIRVTHTFAIETEKVYDVRFTSSTSGRVALPSGIEFTGLNASNNPINVTNNGKRLALKDGDGNDANASFTIDSGDVKFSADGRNLIGSGSVKFTLSWNDRPRTAGVAVQRIKIGTTTWTQSGRSGSETHTVEIGAPDSNNNSNIQLRNKGKNVVQMEDWTDNDWADIICSATEGEFYDMQGRTCKFRVPSKTKTTIEYGRGLVDGSAKDGVTYEGPPISTYTNSDLGPTITPTWTTDEDYIANFNGKEWVMTWRDVDFPEDATYDIAALADDILLVKIESTQVIARAAVTEGISHTKVNVTKGKHDVQLILSNIPLGLPFNQNPTVAAVKITYPVDVAIKDKNGESIGKSWKINPIGISAALIPPPCPKKINGVGIVTDVIIDDPGNSFKTPPPPGGGGDPPSYPVIIECTEITTDGPTGNPGINYGPGDLVCVQNTETGEEICYEPEFGPFGEIEKVPILPDEKMTGFKGWPRVRVRTNVKPGPQPAPTPPKKVPTGIGFVGVPKLKTVRDPIISDATKLIQVTDLVGLKQTGFYDGKPYYGAVFYEDGVRFAGYYDTPGQKVQIYDTLQESIDAEVTTPPSAIQRQGTDINSNDPRLNIPGTPDNLT